MNKLITFIINRLKEVNPWENIKTLHTNVGGDILSGITVAIIALPLALAFGEISQLGPIAGVWGAIAGGIVGGIFGGCMVGVSGPTAPKAAQISAFMGAFVIGGTNQPDLVAAFSIIFLSGLILIAISMLKISKFIHYIPYSVVAGFMCGIGIIVIVTQINAFLGLVPEKDILSVFRNFKVNISNINKDAVYVALPCLLILLLWSSFEKNIKILKNIPSPLIALIVGTSIAYFMDLDIPRIGEKMNETSQNQIFTFYIPDFSRLSEFIGPAFALAGLAILDSLLSCIVADNLTGLRHSSDRETFGQGMANMAAGLVGGVTTATATMRTVANINFGGKTPLASIVHGITLLGILLGLGFLVAAIPAACLAAILFKVGIDIFDYRILPVLRKIPTVDLLVFIIVLFVTVYEDLMIAVAIGVIFSLLSYLKEIKLTLRSKYKHQNISISKSNFKSIELDKLPINVLQPHGPLFFGSVETLMNTYLHAPKHEILIIDMSQVTMIDLSGAYALEDLIKNLQNKKIKAFITNANLKVKKVLQNINLMENLGEDCYKNSKDSINSIILKHYK